MSQNVMVHPEITSATLADWLYVVNDGVTDARIRVTNLPVSGPQQAALDLKANLSSPTITSPTLQTPVINVGSDATGDTYYRSAAGLFTRRPIGTEGFVWTVVSGLPAWAAPTGGGGGGVALSDSPDWTGDHQFLKNSAVSLPTINVTGTWFTGGTSTTTMPHVLIQTSGATANTWSVNGTGLGVNAASGFTGNLLDLQLDGVSKFTVRSTGVFVLNVGSDATGDIYYRAAGGFTRLPIGTAGQVLAVASGLPSWVTGGGGSGDMVLAGAQEVSGAKTFIDGTLIVKGGDYGITDGSMPTGVERAFFLNSNASSRRLFFYNNGAFRALLQVGIDLVNLTSNVTGILPLANGGTGVANYLNAVFNNQTGTTYTLVAADNGKVVTLNNASAITLTIPDLGVGFNCLVVQLGAGAVTFTPSATTRRQRQGHTKTAGQYAVCSVAFHVAAEFLLGGDTAT
jgi:hypothetical protein